MDTKESKKAALAYKGPTAHCGLYEYEHAPSKWSRSEYHVSMEVLFARIP